jgi:hypothetical protein
MKMKEYMSNPLGKGAIFPNRDMVISELNHKYERAKTKVKLFPLTVSVKNGTYFFHVKVPSGSLDGFFYDVALKFIRNKNSNDKTLDDMDFQAFSNSPSFVYTYAHVFNDKRLLANELKPKISNMVYRKNPEVKNPYNMVNFERTIYFAMLEILNRGLTNISNINEISTQYNINIFRGKIVDFDTLMKKRALLDKAQRSRDKDLKSANKENLKNLQDANLKSLEPVTVNKSSITYAKTTKSNNQSRAKSTPKSAKVGRVRKI